MRGGIRSATSRAPRGGRVLRSHIWLHACKDDAIGNAAHVLGCPGSGTLHGNTSSLDHWSLRAVLSRHDTEDCPDPCCQCHGESAPEGHTHGRLEHIAPPARAPTAPRTARNKREATETPVTNITAGRSTTIRSGRVAPTAKVAARSVPPGSGGRHFRYPQLIAGMRTQRRPANTSRSARSPTPSRRILPASGPNSPHSLSLSARRQARQALRSAPRSAPSPQPPHRRSGWRSRRYRHWQRILPVLERTYL